MYGAIVGHIDPALGLKASSPSTSLLVIRPNFNSPVKKTQVQRQINISPGTQAGTHLPTRGLDLFPSALSLSVH